MISVAAQRYQKKKDKEGSKQRRDSEFAREIYDLMPPVKNPARRAFAELHLKNFCDTYFGGVCYNDWTDDDVIMLEAFNRAVVAGTQQAIAAPRGTGKTVRQKLAAVFATLTGLRRFAVCIGASKPNADRMADSIYNYLMFPALREDYPEVCFPIWYTRKAKQSRPLFLGEPINFTNKNGLIVLPNIPGSRAAGARIHCVGIEGSMRGLAETDLENQTEFRPDLILLDDFQTDLSARSETQCDTRLRIISNGIQGLQGSGKTLGIMATITVICANDAADRLLNRKEYPSWRGLRFWFIDPIPTEAGAEPTDGDKARVELWQRYLEIRSDDLIAGGEGEPATAFYRANREAMDHGIEVRWPERFERDKGEISAIQHAANVIQDRGVDALEAEYNNRPRSTSKADVRLQASEIMQRLSRLPRGVAPASATRLTAFVDVHGDVLYWLILATDDKFTGHVIDYGTYPEQRRAIFQKHECNQTLKKAHRDQDTLEAQLTAALHATFDEVIGRPYKRDDGNELRIDRLLVDAQWGEQTETVYRAVRSSAHAASIMPSHGKFIGAKNAPISQWKHKGPKHGHEWRVSPNRGIMKVTFDTNHWKTFVAGRLTVSVGAAGSCQFFGSNPDDHRNIASHLTAEEAVEVTANDRRCFEWSTKTPPTDNHWFDCLVGAHVAASMLGANILHTTNNKPNSSSPSREGSLAERRQAGRNLSRRSRRDD